jgi:hypothetical protein
MTHLRYFLAAAGLATAVATGCSSSSSVGTSDSGPDSPTTDSTPPKTDGKAPPPHSDSGKDTGLDSPVTTMDSPVNTDSPVTTMDGGDAKCNFATFVLNLIKNDTTATATPSTNLGQNCTDDMEQIEFASLF